MAPYELSNHSGNSAVPKMTTRLGVRQPPPPAAANSAIGNAAAANRNAIIFDVSKSPAFTVNSGYKNMTRKLKNNWKVDANRGELTDATFEEAKVFIIAGPKEKYTHAEFESLKSYVNSGGCLLVMLGEGGEQSFDTNLNFLLEEYGIMVNSDSVIRTVFYKYFHPKEALISNGVLNRALAVAAGKILYGADDDENISQSLDFVYPYGATLNVSRQSVPVLSSGSLCFPLNRPVCAFHSGTNGVGRIVVIGSVHIFSDAFLDKEDNSKILDVVIQFLTDDLRLNQIDADDPEVSDYHTIPDTVQLAEQLKVCLQEGEGELPARDFSKLFDSSLYSMDLSLLPRIIKTYEELKVKHEPLNLIQPQFEMPLPPLVPARRLSGAVYVLGLSTTQVFPPVFRDLPPPSLELFDLDESFSTEKVRLAQVTNKCTENDLEYFVRECSDILGVASRLPADQRTAKHVLEFIFAQVAEFKKLNQETFDSNFDYQDEEEPYEDYDDY